MKYYQSIKSALNLCDHFLNFNWCKIFCDFAVVIYWSYLSHSHLLHSVLTFYYNPQSAYLEIKLISLICSLDIYSFEATYSENHYVLKTL